MIKNDNKRIFVTLKKEQIEILEKIASEKNLTKSNIINLAIIDYIKNNYQI